MFTLPSGQEHHVLVTGILAQPALLCADRSELRLEPVAIKTAGLLQVVFMETEHHRRAVKFAVAQVRRVMPVKAAKDPPAVRARETSLFDAYTFITATRIEIGEEEAEAALRRGDFD